MKKIFFGIVVAVSLLFVSCDNNEEALNFYHKAKEAYENGDFLKVKEFSDSSKAKDNTAFDENYTKNIMGFIFTIPRPRLYRRWVLFCRHQRHHFTSRKTHLKRAYHRHIRS